LKENGIQQQQYFSAEQSYNNTTHDLCAAH
jgi:hypothetical protein